MKKKKQTEFENHPVDKRSYESKLLIFNKSNTIW